MSEVSATADRGSSHSRAIWRAALSNPATLALRTFLVLLAALMLFAAFTTDGFLTVDNLTAILTITAFTGIIAVGSTLITLGGSFFSVSTGTTTAVTSILFVSTLRYGVVAAIVVTLLAGTLMSAIQGAVVGTIGANPIIVTLGAVGIEQGVTEWLTPGDISPPANVNINFLARTIFTVPVSVYVFIALAIVGDLLMRHTRFGREIYLLGENRPAARAAGLPVASLTTTAFAVAGLCVAITGILVAGFDQTVNLQVSGTFTFDVIAAILVGGTAVSGGRGSIVQSAIGAVVISVIYDILLLRGASTGVQVLVKGLVVVMVVVLLHLARREGRNS